MAINEQLDAFLKGEAGTVTEEAAPAPEPAAAPGEGRARGKGVSRVHAGQGRQAASSRRPRAEDESAGGARGVSQSFRAVLTRTNVGNARTGRLVRSRQRPGTRSLQRQFEEAQRRATAPAPQPQAQPQYQTPPDPQADPRGFAQCTSSRNSRNSCSAGG